MHAAQGRAGADAVDADVWREGLGKGLGGAPEGGLGERIGEELRVQLPHALVDHIDDVAFGACWQRICETLGKQNRRAQVHLHMGVPIVACVGMRCIVEKG